MKQILILSITLIIISLAVGCSGRENGREVGVNALDCDDTTTYIDYSFEELMVANNRVSAHDERDTIIGNFTGKGIDTLYVKMVSRADIEQDSTLAKYEDRLDLQQDTLYFLESTNPEIPFFQLGAWSWIPPKLVNEGDLDGNGTCDFGYLTTWLNSQWRDYNVITFYEGEWRYLIDDDKLFTSAFFRDIDIEIVEPGPHKGLVKINYLPNDYGDSGVCDTLVSPKYINMETYFTKKEMEQ